MAMFAELEERYREQVCKDSNELVLDTSGACYSQLSAGSFSSLLTNAVIKADIQDSSIQARSPLAGFIYELTDSVELSALLLGEWVWCGVVAEQTKPVKSGLVISWVSLPCSPQLFQF